MARERRRDCQEDGRRSRRRSLFAAAAIMSILAQTWTTFAGVDIDRDRSKSKSPAVHEGQKDVMVSQVSGTWITEFVLTLT